MRLWTSAVIVFLLAAMVARAVQWAVVDADGLEGRASRMENLNEANSYLGLMSLASGVLSVR